MREESRKIQLAYGDVNLEEQLGIYYIDMRAAIIHYTNNIYDGGFDENNVPFTSSPTVQKNYFPINIAQYAFMIHADYIENNSEEKIQILNNCLYKLEELKTEDEKYAIWWHHYDEVKYNISAPWASAMAQGEIISFYLRMYQINNNESLLQTAIKAFNFLNNVEYENKGVRRYLENGTIWLEEYPSNPPSFVLNGFIYAVFGLFDLYRVTKNNQVKALLNQCIESLKTNIDKFDTGYWSRYDLYKKELVRYYYQKNVHVPQLEILYKLTGEKVFKKYSIKWAKTINPFNFLLVQTMYRIQPRWEKMKQKIKK